MAVCFSRWNCDCSQHRCLLFLFLRVASVRSLLSAAVPSWRYHFLLACRLSDGTWGELGPIGRTPWSVYWKMCSLLHYQSQWQEQSTRCRSPRDPPCEFRGEAVHRLRCDQQYCISLEQEQRKHFNLGLSVRNYPSDNQQMTSGMSCRAYLKLLRLSSYLVKSEVNLPSSYWWN